MENAQTCTAFAGERRIASGPRLEVALAIKAATGMANPPMVLIFDDQTGRAIDFDLRGSVEEIASRLTADQPAAEKRSSGRPKLGVVAREVTLLPRHWEWLAAQPGGASTTLRKLVDAARNTKDPRALMRQAQEAADRFMSAMLGNQPGYEEASRALYASNRSRFLALTKAWPRDLRDHARRLAEPAFPKGSVAA